MPVCARSLNLNCASPTYPTPSKQDWYPLNCGCSDIQRNEKPMTYVIAQPCIDVVDRRLCSRVPRGLHL